MWERYAPLGRRSEESEEVNPLQTTSLGGGEHWERLYALSPRRKEH